MLLINGNTLRQETLRQRLKLLTEEKCDLQSQLMDCHLRIEQEGKVWISAVASRGILCCGGVTMSAGLVLLFLRQAALNFFQVINVSATNYHH